VIWPAFSGELIVRERAASEMGGYASDFGGRVSARPRAVLRAADVDDVVRAVRHARAAGLRVVARGNGHTTAGQSQLADGLVIDLRELDRIATPRAETVRVGAGATWSRVVAGTHAHGLMPPVLTDYLGLTVGGTLSVGGVGGQSFAHGLQVDAVIELEVVTGAGTRMRCSADRDAELFHGCLGGLGQLGIIVEATLRLVPAPSRVRVRNLPFVELDGFLAAQHLLARAGCFDYLVGNFLPPSSPRRGAAGWGLAIECVEYVDASRPADALGLPDALARQVVEAAPLELGYLAYAHRLDAMVASWRSSGSWTACHPWMDVFVPRDRAAGLIADALDGLDRDGLGEGYVMTYPLFTRRHRTPMPLLPSDDEPLLFDILPSVPRGDHARLAAFERRHARLLEAALAAGGTIYPIGYPLGSSAIDPQLWRRMLGVQHGPLLATRRRHDPDGICGAELAMR
jgi:cytokinin dehydrogenase